MLPACRGGESCGTAIYRLIVVYYNRAQARRCQILLDKIVIEVNYTFRRNTLTKKKSSYKNCCIMKLANLNLRSCVILFIVNESPFWFFVQLNSNTKEISSLLFCPSAFKSPYSLIKYPSLCFHILLLLSFFDCLCVTNVL